MLGIICVTFISVFHEIFWFYVLDFKLLAIWNVSKYVFLAKKVDIMGLCHKALLNGFAHTHSSTLFHLWIQDYCFSGKMADGCYNVYWCLLSSNAALNTVFMWSTTREQCYVKQHNQAQWFFTVVEMIKRWMQFAGECIGA